jgi:hypothetical protein
MRSGEQRARTVTLASRAAATLRIALFGAAVLVGHARAQMLETETARLLPAGTWQWGAGLVYQSSSDGRTAGVPLELGYGITDSLQLNVEPLAYLIDLPAAGDGDHGYGHTDVRLTYLLCSEGEYSPALAVAGELKLPSAYLIASKRFGDFDAHVNYTRTFVERLSGMSLDNFDTFALAAVYRPDPGWELFGEFLGSSSTNGASTASPITVIPESADNYRIGTLGFGKFYTESLLWYFALSADNNDATTFRTGFQLKL